MRTNGLNPAFAHSALAHYQHAPTDRSLRFPAGWWLLPAVAGSLAFWVWAITSLVRMA